jgi:hypothetical protein
MIIQEEDVAGPHCSQTSFYDFTSHTVSGICSQICAKYTRASDPLEGSETEKCCCFVYNFYRQI